MTDASLPLLERQPWWYEDDRSISCHLAGVFEGGGVKGIAYIGALERLADAGFWFRRVAGSSAGALTAALVASGATPTEIRTGMNQMLRSIRGGKMRQARRMLRLYWHGGMFANKQLHVWLENWLAHQVRGVPLDESNLSPAKYIDPDRPVTFRELYEATKIELNVVAANLSIQRQMVFSHHDTKDCQVSDAVIASCSLPLAFHNADMIATDDQDQQRYIYTVVDGGVWSNFPIWIFTDKAFESWAKRTEVPDVAGVVGFILRGPRPDEVLPDARFHRYTRQNGLSGRMPVRAFEWRTSSVPVVFNALPLLAPTKLLDAIGVRALSRARWPDPRGYVKRFFGSIVESWLRLMSAAPAGVVVLGAAAYGGYLTYRWVHHRVSARGDMPLGIFLYGVESVYILGGITITLIALFALNFLLGTAIRRVGYGLMRTLATAPGAPVWVEERNDVIVIPLPEGATTLNFDFDPEVLINAGRQAVEQNLPALRNRLEQEA